MTPQEKAKEIWKDVMKLNYWGAGHKNTKAVAIYTVNQIILANPHSNPLNTDVHSTMGYWNEVKCELEKM